MTATTDNRELRALVQRLRDVAPSLIEPQAVAYRAIADRIEALLTRTEAGESAPVADGLYAWVRESPRHWERVTESDLSQPADPQKMRADGWFPVFTHPQDASAVAELIKAAESLADEQVYSDLDEPDYEPESSHSSRARNKHQRAYWRVRAALAALQQKESGRE